MTLQEYLDTVNFDEKKYHEVLIKCGIVGLTGSALWKAGIDFGLHIELDHVIDSCIYFDCQFYPDDDSKTILDMEYVKSEEEEDAHRLTIYVNDTVS